MYYRIPKKFYDPPLFSDNEDTAATNDSNAKILSDGYAVAYNVFCNKPIDAEIYSGQDSILNVFWNIFKNVDCDLVNNLEFLQKVGFLEQKSRTYYNYVLLKEDLLSNMRQLGVDSLKMVGTLCT